MLVYREPGYDSDVFSSGTVIVPGVAGDRVLYPAAGPIKITRTGNDPAGGFDFDGSEEISPSTAPRSWRTVAPGAGARW